MLGWLPDIRGWARVVAHFLAPGGTFFITEAHPVSRPSRTRAWRPASCGSLYPYWEHRDPLVFDVKGSYADPAADVGEQKEHGWDHGLGEIVTALIDAGLRIESLEEHPYLDWAADFLVESAPGSGRSCCRPGAGELPLMFSLRATKPAAAERAYTSPFELSDERTDLPSVRPERDRRTTMTKHSRAERERRAAETVRVKEIEAAWLAASAGRRQGLQTAVAAAAPAAGRAARPDGPGTARDRRDPDASRSPRRKSDQVSRAVPRLSRRAARPAAVRVASPRRYGGSPDAVTISIEPPWPTVS